MIIKTAIIDDDKVFTTLIEHYLSQIDFLEHQRTYNDSTIAYNELNSNMVDVLFLDMKIPKMSGLELINSFTKIPELVFVSSSNEYGPEAFEHDAIDYLHKPVSLGRFLKCAKKIKMHFERNGIGNVEQDESIFVRNNGIWQKLKLSEICSIKADNNHIVINTDNGKIRTNMKMKEIVDKLPEHDFMQVHRSYIVQLKKIAVIDGEILEINNRTIPISKTYLDKLYNRLNIR